jgi:M6 family metalloprotease-like protein
LRTGRTGIWWLAATAGTLAASRALAAPVAPATFTLAQPDGATFPATNWGDERAAGVETLSGYTVVRGAAGSWVYAIRGAGGQLGPSVLVVGRDAPAGISPHLRPAPPAPGMAPGPAPLPAGAPARIGTHRLLVLVVEFTPAQSLGTTEADWEAHVFSGGSSTAPRSIADYWSEVSYGQIALGPAAESWGIADNGVVEVTLPYPHPDSAGDDSNRKITADAIVASDPYVDYSAFDDNGDGYLNSNELHLLVVARGYERAYGGANVCTGAGSVWAHHWSLYGSVPAPTVDGVVVGYEFGAPAPGPYQGGYNQMGEWHCATWDDPGHMATIGVGTHELGHDMGTGVPDLYDTDSSSSGIGRWGLQGSGGWNTTGAYIGMTPAWPDAWSRWFFGILVPAQPSACENDRPFPRVETAAGAPDHGVVRLRDNPGGVDWEWGSSGTGEYFLVENRQQVGFDAGLPGSGLVVWHVYEAAPGDNSANADEGTCPPGNARLVVLEQADGDFDLECFDTCGGACNTGDGADLWRAGGGTTFDGSSTPSSDLYSGAATDVAVTDVSASGAMMTADLAYGPCDDGDACTSGDACSAGTCAGTPYSCDDGNVCTTDSCNGAGGCSYSNNSDGCMSSDPCALPPKNGTCMNGTCAAAIIYDCFPSDPCHLGQCDGSGGCLYPPISGPACDDANACTSSDTCNAGTCTGTPYSCDDGNVCTTDSCNGDGTCAHAANSLPCDDGVACTTGDVCSGGACNGVAYGCNDGNPCTTDSCNGAGGCSFANNSLSCDDGSSCTSGDTCRGGACVGVTYSCDDGNLCTTDSCNGDGTCVHAANSLPCDDGLACTAGDACAGGSCTGIAYGCDDANPCTTDSCDGTGACTHANNTFGCSDGDPCTSGDRCSAGVCAGTPVACDDGDACTTDTCVGGTCTFTNNTAPCDDGDACTFGDACGGGVCVGTPYACDDANACTNDSCDGDGTCTFADNVKPCDDADPCTASDTCGAGMCAGVAYVCDDDNPCTTDECLGNGECSFTANTLPCDDGDPCTENDTCGGGSCAGTVNADCVGGDGGTAHMSSSNGCGCALGAAQGSRVGWFWLLAAVLVVGRRALRR